MPRTIHSSEQEVLSRLLRDQRHRAHLTQTEVAARLDRPQSFVAKYESGERRLDVIELREVCSVLGIRLSTFAAKLERALD